MNTAKNRAFYMMLMGGFYTPAGPPPVDTGCLPYTRPASNAVNINLTEDIERLASNIVNINLCEEM